MTSFIMRILSSVRTAVSALERPGGVQKVRQRNEAKSSDLHPHQGDANLSVENKRPNNI